MTAYTEHFRVEYDKILQEDKFIRNVDNVIIKQGKFDYHNYQIIGDKTYYCIQIRGENDENDYQVIDVTLIDMETLEQITFQIEEFWNQIVSNSTGSTLLVLEFIFDDYCQARIYEKVENKYIVIEDLANQYDEYEGGDEAFLGQKFPVLNHDQYRWIDDNTIEATGENCVFHIRKIENVWTYIMISYTPEFVIKMNQVEKDRLERPAYKERIKAENPRYAQMRRYFNFDTILLPLHPRSSPYYRDSQYADCGKYGQDMCYNNSEHDPAIAPFLFDLGEGHNQIRVWCFIDKYGVHKQCCYHKSFDTLEELLECEDIKPFIIPM